MNTPVTPSGSGGPKTPAENPMATSQKEGTPSTSGYRESVPTPDMTPGAEKNHSMLDSIIASAQGGSTSGGNTMPPGTNNSPENIPNGTPPAKKPRDPMTTSMILKLIGSLLLVSIIFFGSFLAYIVFNPDQAGFFISVFRIDPNDVAHLLKSLINVSFGILIGALAIIWIVVLFRAIWTPKEQKRKRIMGWFVSILTGMILFGLLAFWAYLFETINATDYTNPGGRVLVYDNDLYISDIGRPISRVTDFTNMIGPISLRFDISQNAKQVSDKNGITIGQFDINFDGALCEGDQSRIRGSNPLTASAIVCTFDQIRSYNIYGTYTYTNRLGEVITIDIPMNPVEIRGMLTITQQKNREGKNTITIDASRVRNLGIPRWIYDSNPQKKIEENTITETPSTIPFLVCLQVLKDNQCDRFFLIEDKQNVDISGTIEVIQDPTRNQEYTFKLTNLDIPEDEIIDVNWTLNNTLRICTNNASSECTHTFNTFGNFLVQANIRLADNRTLNISRNLNISEPLRIERRVRVLDRAGQILNPENTFDVRTQSFVIRDIIAPTNIILDGRDVLADNAGYTLENIEWEINNGSRSETRLGERIEFEVTRNVRYTINAKYTFRKTIQTGRDDDIKEAKDTVILDLERKNLVPVLKIQKSSDYVPSRVTVDASQSQSEYSEIVKFIFDFGEGRPETVGDAIQTYEYRSSGEKTITLTVIDAQNERATTKETIILKDTPNTIGFNTSMSPGVVGIPTDFVADETTGQIEEYIWNFGDNTPIGYGYSTTHTYAKPGTYIVTLTVRYIGGTEQSTRKTFIVTEGLE